MVASSPSAADRSLDSPGRMMSSVHPAAARLPAPARTGDELTDGDAAARHLMLQEMVTILLADDSHTADLYTRLKQRVDTKVKQADAQHTELFKTFASFRALDSEWAFSYITKHSDLTASDVIAARMKNEDSTAELMTWVTQLPGNLRMTPACQVKPVFSRICDTRRLAVGDRLHHFKQKGGLAADGSVNWKQCGAYTAKFDNAGRLIELRHISGDSIVCSPNAVTNHFVLIDNYSDWQAAFLLRPMPPVKVHMFFKPSGTGPYKAPAMTNTAKPWIALLEQAESDWQSAKRVAQGDVAPAGAEAKQQIREYETRVKKDRAEKARAKATEVLQAKRRRREISLAEAASATPEVAA